MELLGTSIVGKYFTADICYDFPTNDPEWMLGGMSPEYIVLSNRQETIPVYSMGMIGDLKTDSNGNYTSRCDHLKFPILPSTLVSANLRIAPYMGCLWQNRLIGLDMASHIWAKQAIY